MEDSIRITPVGRRGGGEGGPQGQILSASRLGGRGWNVAVIPKLVCTLGFPGEFQKLSISRGCD